MSDEKRDIYTQINKVMKDVGAIEKDQTNSHQRYKFRGIDDIFNALSGPLCKHGVFVSPEVRQVEYQELKSSKGGTLIYARVICDYKIYGPEGDYICAGMAGEAMDTSDKATNKAMSAAYKYLWFQLLCIPTEEVDDADQTTPQPAPRNQSVPRGTPPPDTTRTPAESIAERQATHAIGAARTVQELDNLKPILAKESKKMNEDEQGRVKQAFGKKRQELAAKESMEEPQGGGDSPSPPAETPKENSATWRDFYMRKFSEAKDQATFDALHEEVKACEFMTQEDRAALNGIIEQAAKRLELQVTF